jgi:1-acyl-sn-glycerol-3-phosphate acyltransferase
MVRAILVLLATLLWTLVLLPVQILAVRFSWRLMAEAIPVLYHRGLAWLMRVHVRTVGEMSRTRPTLFVANHISWLDIVVIDTLIRGSYVTKREVMGWPGFGTLAKLQRCVFIERKAHRTKDHKDEMQLRLEQGDNLILFAEGTSSDGMRILPFKSSFFALAEQPVNGRPLTVQPVSIAYCRLNGLPVGRRWMEIFSWTGDESLVPHLWRFLRAGPSVVEVAFHQPVTIESFASRKDLSAWCQTVVAHGVSAGLTGRPVPTIAVPARSAARPAPLPAPAAPATA